MLRSFSPRLFSALLPSQQRWSIFSIVIFLAALSAVAVPILNDKGRGQLWSAVQNLWEHPGLVVLFVATYTAAFYLRALAWNVLLSGTHDSLRLFSALQVSLLANHLFPTKVGELIRVGLLCRQNVSIECAASSTALARLLDFFALCLIALTAGVVAGGHPTVILGLLSMPVLIVILGIGMYLVLANASYMERLSFLSSQRLTATIYRMGAYFRASSSSQILVASMLVLPSWILESFALWSVAQAMGVSLPFVTAVATTAFTITFQAFQVTPGGLGMYETSQTAALSLYGVEPSTGLTLALVTHGLKYLYSYVVGFPFLVYEGVVRPSKGDNKGFWGVPDGAKHVLSLIRRNLLCPAILVHSTAVSILGRKRYLAGSLPRMADPAQSPQIQAFIMALISYLAVHLGQWTSPSFWQSLLVSVAAIVPLIALATCHHLPQRLSPVVLTSSGALLFLLFGIPEPPVVLSALLMGTAVAFRRRNKLAAQSGVISLAFWSFTMAEALAVSTSEPMESFIFYLGLLVTIVLVRQWWLSNSLPARPEVLASGGQISVVIPVYNESATIGGIVKTVPRHVLEQQGYDVRVIVVDDGSDDGSGDIARAGGADLVTRHETRRGLGAALRTGLHLARDLGSDAAVYLDGDGEYDPADVPAVLQPIINGEADYVMGSRFPRASTVMCGSRLWGNRAFTVLLSILVGRRIQDGQTGFRAFSRRALQCAEIIHDYNYAQVLTLDLLRKRMLLAHVAVSYRPRSYGRSFIKYNEYLYRVLPAMLLEVLKK